MKLNTTNTEYIETVELIEVYQHLQAIIDRVRNFDLSEALADQTILIMWARQLEAIKRDAQYIEGSKSALLKLASSKMMGFIGEE